MVDFRYYLNRQGPRGQQGVKGEQGYSPQVTVGKNTASEFTLKVINEDGSFETENLKVVPENRGGTYVRYDKDTYQEYIGDPDIATTRTFGVVRLATKEDIGTQEESRAVTSALLDTYLQENYLNKVHGDVVTGDVDFRGRTGFTQPIGVHGLRGHDEKQYLTRSDTSTAIGSLTIPDDDSRLTQGPKEIAYTSDLTEFVTNAVLNSAISNLVTLDTDQQISGKKNFANGISLNSAIQFNISTALIKGDKSGSDIILGAYDDRLMIGSQNTRPIKLNSNSITDYNGNNLLSYANIVPGNNITIEKTSTGIKISSTAQGDVTLAGDNSFTGNNTFDGVSTFNGDTWVDSLKVGTSLTNQQNKKFLAQGSITAGDNVTIEETTDGVKISSTGGSVPANMVTTDTEQTITGQKTINDPRIASQFKYTAELQFETKVDNGTRIVTAIGVNELDSRAITVGDAYNYKLFLKGTSVVNKYDKKFLVQGSITAGSDNLIISDTTDGVQITCNAPTNAQIEALQRLINDLSTKVDNLTTRLDNLEEVIDGGVAGSIYPADPQKIDALSDANSGIENGKAASEDIQIKDGE